MKVHETADKLGKEAACYISQILNDYIANQGYARLLLSTGASQLSTLEALVKMDIDWGRVEAFHLDEYIALSPDHPASFRRYLQDKFANEVSLGKMHFVESEGNVLDNIKNLTH